MSFLKGNIKLKGKVLTNNPTSYLQGMNNKFVSCMVDGDTVWFQGIVGAGSATTYMRIRYAETSMDNEGALSAVASGSADEVIRLSITGLPDGKKYFYRVQIGATESSLREVVAPDGDRYFVTQPTATGAFKFIIIADSHLNGYQKHGQLAPFRNNSFFERGDENHSAVEKYITDEEAFRAEIKRFSAGILAKTPDFIMWHGDDIFTEYHTTEVRRTMYRNFSVATSELGLPQFFTVGNHEGENNGAENIGVNTWIDPTNGNPLRQNYLLHPSTGAPARYGYSDYGPVRIIYLSPYAYSPTIADVPEEDVINFGFVRATSSVYSILGAAQESFLASALTGSQKLNMIFLHNFPYMGTNFYSYWYGEYVQCYGVFGGITQRNHATGLDEDFSYQKGNKAIFDAIKASGKQTIIFQCHAHLYSREQQVDGIYVYGAPAIFNWRQDPETEVAGYVQATDTLRFYAFGYSHENGSPNPNYLSSDLSLAHLTVEVNPVAGTLKTYCIDKDGAKVTAIPELTISFTF